MGVWGLTPLVAFSGNTSDAMRLKAIFLLAPCLYAASAFAGFTLVPGTPLHGRADIYEASGRNGLLIRQKLRFGPYATTSVRRGAITGWWGATGYIDQIWMREETARQSIRYTLTDGTDTVEAIARSGLYRTSLIVGTDPNALPSILAEVLTTGTELHQNNLSVALHLPGSAAPWELFLDNNAAQLQRRHTAGYLRGERGYYTLVPVWRVARKGRESDLLFGAVGLEFRNETGDAVAAVNLMDGGAVHLSPDLTGRERLLLASACTALLLQSNLD